MKKKLKVLSEFKTPLPLFQVDKIKVLLPYEDGRTLEKTSVAIIDAESSIIELTMTDFELQGLKEGISSFTAKVYMKNGDMYNVLFSNGLKIGLNKEGKKAWI